MFGGAAVVAGLATVYLLVRLLAIDRFVTSDEPLWLGRSANFLTALLNDDPAGTFQFAHPGVMTMWSGALAIWLVAPEYASTFTTPIRYVFNIHMRLREISEDPLEVMIAARTSKILLQTIVFAIAITFLGKHYGRMAGLIAGGLIALDPFTGAIDSVLHVDGLAAIFMVTAVLTIPTRAGLNARTAAMWALAGVLGGMAVLTRWMALMLYVPIGMMLLFHLHEQLQLEPRWRAIRSVFISGAIVTAAMIVTCLALWPALRHDPVMVLEGIWGFSSGAASEGHELPTFFLGTIHEGDAGPWFYPVALVWRSTPVVLLGLVFLGVTLVRDYRRIVNPRMSAALFAFAMTMTLVMTVAGKKFDRYLLSVNLVLMIFAAIGLGHAVVWSARRWRARDGGTAQRAPWVPQALLAILLGAQLLSTMTALPYRFAYFNPLLGGTTAAENALQLGWGEGMDQAAEIIQADYWPEDSEAPPATVRLTVNREQVLYFLPETYVVYPHVRRVETVQDWHDTDYFVLSIQRWQRNLEPEIHDYLWQFEPLDSVFINGVEYARVYKLAEIPPPPWLPDD